VQEPTATVDHNTLGSHERLGAEETERRDLNHSRRSRLRSTHAAARGRGNGIRGDAMTTMRAVQVTRHGSPGEVLAVADGEVPEPDAGEVRVRVGAASLNFNDIDRCRGKLVSVPTPPPYTLGMDVCGVVDAAGVGAEHWIGQRVVAITKTALGGIAEYAIAPAVSVFAAPPELDDAEATAFLLTFHTSHLALFRRGRLRSGETVVIHSAASGLGSAGVQLAKAAGARVIAVAGGPEKVALCRDLGADVVVDHTTDDFVEAVFEATDDRGADVVYDLSGGEVVEGSWRCTAREGRYLAVGFADDDDNGMTGRPLRMACIGNISIVGVMLAWVDEVDPGMRRFGFNPFGRDVADEVHADLLRQVAEGHIRPVVGRRVAMADAGTALDDHEQRRSIGRTVVIVAPTG
jgi:NADPH2:quinone reductase